jgi:AcrR family transcriptional regulator
LEPSSREKIPEVAEARFAQRGFTGVGTGEVTEAAGLGKSSLFHHFPSRATLYRTLLEEEQPGEASGSAAAEARLHALIRQRRARGPVFSVEAVGADRRERKQLLRSGLVGPPRAPKETRSS